MGSHNKIRDPEMHPCNPCMISDMDGIPEYHEEFDGIAKIYGVVCSHQLCQLGPNNTSGFERIASVFDASPNDYIHYSCTPRNMKLQVIGAWNTINPINKEAAYLIKHNVRLDCSGKTHCALCSPVCRCIKEDATFAAAVIHEHEDGCILNKIEIGEISQN